MKLTCVQESRDMSDGLVKTNDSEDSDDPDGESLPGTVEVNMLVPGHSGLVSGWKKYGNPGVMYKRQ